MNEASTEFKLAPELKQRWTAALRSGRFSQGERFLKTMDNRYCCLGVLAVVQGSVFLDHKSFYQVAPYHDYITEETEYLKEDIVPGYIQRELAELNDGAQWKFPAIADWIEENL